MQVAPEQGVRLGSHAERAVTWLSLACAIHCLVVPAALSLMPLLGSTSIAGFGAKTELLLTLLVVASALLGVTWGYRRHRDVRIVFATAFGLIAYLVGHLFEGSWYGLALALLGALMLAASSFVSARLTHASRHSTCAH